MVRNALFPLSINLIFLNLSSAAKIPELRGNVACRGEVQGKVRGVMSKFELASFQTGEILVTTMRTIEFVHAMKKATAIITDEGGITCHAAIFSREFGIPCIIGTQIVTKTFQNGDVVEVEAEKGVIRKI